MFATHLLHRHLKWLLPLIVVALSLITFVLLKASRAQAPARPVEEKIWSVRTNSVMPRPQQPEIELYGAIEAPQMASLRAAIEADVIELPAREGARVHAGELLLQLDPRDVELALRQQQAQLDSLLAQIQAEQVRHGADLANIKLQRDLVALKEADLQRYLDLSKRKLASQQQIDSARVSLQQQRLSLNTLEQSLADHPNRLAQLQAEQQRLEALVAARQLDLARSQIRAPYEARIAAVNVARGDRVRGGDQLIDLYDLARLEVRAQLPERLLAQVRPALAANQPLLAQAQFDGQPLTLRLDRLGAKVSAGRAGVDALFQLVDPGLIPEPGRSLSLKLTLPPLPDLIALPPQALYGTDRVYRVVDERLQSVQVERIGQRRGGDGGEEILVRSPELRAGDQVITTQLPNAIAGLHVRIADAAANAALAQQTETAQTSGRAAAMSSSIRSSGSGMSGLIALFATHRVAANLLMILMLLAGAFGIRQLNVQFFPSFELDVLTVQVTWRGSTAEDVERSILLPIEEEMRSLDGIDQLISTARDGVASLRIELREGTDVDYALSEAKQKLDSVRGDLPDDIDEPLVQRVVRYEGIANLILTSDRANLDELRIIARRFESELLARGVRKIDFVGMPEQELAIQIAPERLSQLGMTFNEVVDAIRQRSIDLPAGTAAQSDGARQIRSLGQQRDVAGFEQLPLLTASQGQLLRLGDVAEIERRDADEQVLLSYHGQPAIMLQLKRTESDDTLVAANILNSWLEQVRPTLPQGVELVPYQESWQLIRDRIELLLKNGASGLLLVIAILFLFLNGRVAFWVTVGIPVSFMATLAALYAIGGTLNMMSLFGLIMALGIIVDDAIVVGEDTLAHAQMGEASRRAAIGGALRMQAPVIASSLTTIAAFLPLLLVGGIIGNILIDIPTVVICVILASLVECFLVLPGHLHHSLLRADAAHPSRLRQRLDDAFNHFRDRQFRPFIETAIRYRWTCLASALGLLIVAIGLLFGGQLKFNFFPAVEGDTMNANVQFSAGTDAREVVRFLDQLDRTLYDTDQALGGGLVKVALAQQRTANFARTSAGPSSGDEFGVLAVELIPADSRGMPTSAFIREWRQRIQVPAGVEKFSIDVSQSGPPGKPIEVKLTGNDLAALKQASQRLQTELKGYTGLSNVDDDLPFGTTQLIYRLTPAGEAAGLRLEQVGRQLRAAFDGTEVQSFYEGQDQIKVRVMLPERDRDRLATLEQLPIVLPDGSVTPLTNVVSFSARRGFDLLQRIDGKLAINVTADLDETAANANEIIAALQQQLVPMLTADYGVEASFEGRNRNQRETLADMQVGLGLALALIYIILAWVFASYSWPLTVMLAIPLGLTGALFGHFLTGQSLTVLSLFGCFGLSGIVINDSIVLVTFYKQLRGQGMSVHDAVVEAACQRLRAVLLTSLTTIGGLCPILFETSLQAQFLIPMSIVFGLGYGTLLILVVVPSMLTILEGTRERLGLKPVTEHQAVTAPE